MRFISSIEEAEDENVLPILALTDSQSGLVTARGTLLKPSFETLPISTLDELDASKPLDLSRNESLRSLLVASTGDKQAKKKSAMADAVVLSGEMGGVEGMEDDVFDEDLDVQGGAGGAGKEMSLGERVKSLDISKGVAESTTATAAKQKIPASSLLSLLTQALRTSDPALLESCLNTSHLPTIKSTLQKLPTQWILPFLNAIEARIRSRPARTRQLLPWLRTALLVHAGYLTSHPTIPTRLASLESLLRARVGTVTAMYALLGRLEIAMRSVESRQQNEEEGEMTVYREEDDVEEEDMDEDEVEGMEGWEEEEEGFMEVCFSKIDSRIYKSLFC